MRSNILAIILSIAFISTPFIVSAQTSVDFRTQLQSISTELQSVLQQVVALVSSAASGQQVDTSGVSSKLQSIKQEFQSLLLSMKAANATVAIQSSEARSPTDTNTAQSSIGSTGPGISNDGVPHGRDPVTPPTLPGKGCTGDQCPLQDGIPGGTDGSNKSCSEFARDLSIGSQGNDVTRLQHILASNGFVASANATGFFGPLTAGGVELLQARFGITPTGTFGPRTRQALRDACAQLADTAVVTQEEDGGGFACTRDAKQCPDGSFVGRTGPHCEFVCSGVTLPTVVVSPPPPHPICPVIARTLTSGSSGDDVRDLQEFLRDEGHLSAEATGYYGSMTAQAVAKWQLSQGISAAGSVGPISRERIKIWCGKMSALKASPTSGLAPLTVNFWHVLGDKPSSDYSIDFGDGTTGTPKIGCGTPPNAAIEACPRALVATHTYAKDGTYRAVLSKITDLCGGNRECEAPVQKEIVGTVTITVRAATVTPPQGCTREYTPVCGRPSGCANVCTGTSCPKLCQIPVPQTYSNRCTLKAAGAQFLHEGACTATSASGGSGSSGSISTGTGTVTPSTGSGSDDTTVTNDSLSATPSSGSAPLRVLFRASRDWSAALAIEFGDGASGALTNNCSGDVGACGQPTAQHTYAAAGTYTATLVLTSPGGCGAITDPVCLGAPASRQVLGTVTITVRASAPISDGTGVTGTVLLGPTCPVVQNPPDPRCADKPFATSLAVTTADGSKVIKTFSSDANGAFKIALLPGTYAIASAGTQVLPRCSSNGTFTVSSGKFTTVAVSCDSGIR